MGPIRILLVGAKPAQTSGQRLLALAELGSHRHVGLWLLQRLVLIGTGCGDSRIYISFSPGDHRIVLKVFFTNFKLCVFDGRGQIGRLFINSVQAARIFSLQDALNVAHFAKF